MIYRTYIEDMKNPEEVLLPTRDHIFTTLAVEESRTHVPFALLDSLLPNRGQSSGVKTFVSETPGIRVLIQPT